MIPLKTFSLGLHSIPGKWLSFSLSQQALNQMTKEFRLRRNSFRWLTTLAMILQLFLYKLALMNLSHLPNIRLVLQRKIWSLTNHSRMFSTLQEATIVVMWSTLTSSTRQVLHQHGQQLRKAVHQLVYQDQHRLFSLFTVKTWLCLTIIPPPTLSKRISRTTRRTLFTNLLKSSTQTPAFSPRDSLF